MTPDDEKNTRNLHQQIATQKNIMNCVFGKQSSEYCLQLVVLVLQNQNGNMLRNPLLQTTHIARGVVFISANLNISSTTKSLVIAIT